MCLEEDQLILTKWWDETFLVDDIAWEEAQKLYQMYNENAFQNLNANTNPKILEAIKKLETAWVLYQSVPTKKEISFFIKWYFDENKKITDLLYHYTKNDPWIQFSESEHTADLLFIVRSNSKLQEVYQDYGHLKAPHIFIDLSFDHTISIWPLVFPWYTSCVWCFVGRITNNWWDMPPPQLPSVWDSYELISALIFEYLKHFQSIGSCPDLINQVWSFNLRDFTSKYDKIYRLPWCPICFPPKEIDDQTGSFELPWIWK